jgi:hypothetical protein
MSSVDTLPVMEIEPAKSLLIEQIIKTLYSDPMDDLVEAFGQMSMGTDCMEVDEN